jgi:hypothetical protein
VHQNYGQDNQLLNNIFAFGALGEFDRNKNEDHLSFTAQHNVTYAGAVGVLFGNYGCTSTTGAPVPCADHFVFDHNLYFNPAGTVTFGGASLATWQGKGEDVNSKIADPHFNDPTHDDFSFADPSVAKSVGFVPFEVAPVARRSPRWRARSRSAQAPADTRKRCPSASRVRHPPHVVPVT